MTRVFIVGLLALATCGVGCETGSQRENLPTQGAKGQKVGMNSNKKNGPVPSSTTGTEGDMQMQPDEQQKQPVPDTSGQYAPRK